MTKAAIIWRLLEYFLLLVDRFKTEKHREEGRSEVHTKIEARDAEQARAAEEISRANAGSDLGALEQRMRPHERVNP